VLAPLEWDQNGLAVIDKVVVRAAGARPDDRSISRLYMEYAACDSRTPNRLILIEQTHLGVAECDSVLVIIDNGSNGLLGDGDTARRFAVNTPSLSGRLRYMLSDATCSADPRETPLRGVPNLLTTESARNEYQQRLLGKLESYDWRPLIPPPSPLGPTSIKPTIVEDGAAVRGLTEAIRSSTSGGSIDQRSMRKVLEYLGWPIDRSIDVEQYSIEVCDTRPPIITVTDVFDVNPQWVGSQHLFWLDAETWYMASGPGAAYCVEGSGTQIALDVAVQLYPRGSPSRSMTRVPVAYEWSSDRMKNVSGADVAAWREVISLLHPSSPHFLGIVQKHWFSWLTEYGFSYAPAEWVQWILLNSGDPCAELPRK
jgi:hypothetical protein